MLWRRLRRLWWLLLVGFAAETQFCVSARNPLLQPLLGVADPQSWLQNLQTIGTAALGATAAVAAVRALGSTRSSNGVHRSLRPVDASALSRLAERAASFPSKPHSPTHEIVRKEDAKATIDCGVPITAETLQRLLKGMRYTTELVRVMEANNETLVVSERATIGWRTQVFKVNTRVRGNRLELTITGPPIGAKRNSGNGLKVVLHIGGDDDHDATTAVCLEASSSEAFQHTAEAIVEAMLSHLPSQLSAHAARQRIAGTAREALQQERLKRQQAKVDKVLHPEKYRTKRTRPSSASGRSSAAGQRSTRWESSRMQSMKRG